MLKVYCEDCQGAGSYEEEYQRGVPGSGGERPCPPCGGKGYTVQAQEADRKLQPPVGFIAPHDLKLLGEGYPVMIAMLAGAKRTEPLYTGQKVPELLAKVPGRAVQIIAAEIVAALLADEQDGGYDLEAGMFGRNFSALVRRWATLEYSQPSLTTGMTIAQRILHVGGRNNAAGYVEFGSTQAVEALVRQVLRDLPERGNYEPHS